MKKILLLLFTSFALHAVHADGLSGGGAIMLESIACQLGSSCTLSGSNFIAGSFTVDSSVAPINGFSQPSSNAIAVTNNNALSFTFTNTNNLVTAFNTGPQIFGRTSASATQVTISPNRHSTGSVLGLNAGLCADADGDLSLCVDNGAGLGRENLRLTPTQVQVRPGITLALFGSTSGSATLAPAAVAGSGSLMLPTGTDTLVGKATTDTFTNKTLDCGGTGNACTVRIGNDVSGLGFGAAALLAGPSTGTGGLVGFDHPAFNGLSAGSQKITSVAAGSANDDVATFGQVADAIAGFQSKVAALWTTTANITLSGLGTQGGGEWTGTLNASDRILVKDQTSNPADGCYAAAAGSWARTTDCDTGAEVTKASLLILNGATYEGYTFTQKNTVTTIGTDTQLWDPTALPQQLLTVDNSTIELNGGTQIREKDAGTTNAKLANMAQATFKGRAAAAGTGVPVDLTAAQAKTALAIAATDVSGLATIATSGSASDLAAGTVGATRGGAGTVTGILKANGSGTVSAAVANTDYASYPVSLNSGASGVLQAAQFPALTGDGTTSAGNLTFTLATVNSGIGIFGDASNVPTITLNAKGLATAASSTAIQIVESQVTNLVSDLAAKAPTSRNLTAGAGLAGGGTLAADRTFNVGQNADNSIIVNADDIQRAALSGDITCSLGSNTCAVTNLPSGTTAAGSLLATAIAAPSTPAAGKGSIYFDSTSKNLAAKDDAGVIKHGIQTVTATTSQWISAINDAGAGTKSQPGFSDLSGSVACAQLPAIAGNVTSSAGSCTTTVAAAPTTALTGTLQAAQFPAQTGDVTNSAGSLVTAIGANKVTNAQAAQMAPHTFKGNNTGSTANALDLTQAQLTADLNLATTSLQGMMSPNDKIKSTGCNLGADVTTSGTAAFTLLSCQIDGTQIAVGDTFNIHVDGVSAAAGNTTWSVAIGTANPGTTVTFTTAALTNATGAAGGGMDATCTVKTTGVSGTMTCAGVGRILAVIGSSATATAQTINTTGAFFITSRVAMSASTFRATGAFIKKM